MNSLKQQLKDYIFSIYPSEMSSGDVENFAKEHHFNAETGRKRMSDLRAEGFVKTRETTIKKLGGKHTPIAFHQALSESHQSHQDAPSAEISTGYTYIPILGQVDSKTGEIKLNQSTLWPNKKLLRL
jgi:hypothetical protein